MKFSKVIKNPIKDTSSNNREYLNELNRFLKIESQLKNNLKTIKTSRKKSSSNSNYLGDLASDSHQSISYIPKRKVKFIPGNLISHADTNSIPIKIKSQEKNVSKSLFSLNNSLISMNNNNNKSNYDVDLVYNEYGIKNNSVDPEYLNFKTNFILKFSKNIAQYEKLYIYTDAVSDNYKRNLALDNMKKLKNLSEKKDRMFFEDSQVKNNANTSYFNWKEMIIFFFEFETLLQKIFDIVFKELKNTKDLMISIAKKSIGLESQLKEKDQELSQINEFIKENDLHGKMKVYKQKQNNYDELKKECQRKENLNMINVYRLEEE